MNAHPTVRPVKHGLVGHPREWPYSSRVRTDHAFCGVKTVQWTVFRVERPRTVARAKSGGGLAAQLRLLWAQSHYASAQMPS